MPTPIAQPVEQFATWHHLRRIRAMPADDRTLRGPAHHSKQEITQAITFLTWLDATHGRTLSTCLLTALPSETGLELSPAAGLHRRERERDVVVEPAG